MKKLIFAAICMLLAGPWCYSQVLIGTPLSFGTPRPAPQAVLELAATNQGLLLPRVADTNAVANGGIAGLMIYARRTISCTCITGRRGRRPVIAIMAVAAAPSRAASAG